MNFTYGFQVFSYLVIFFSLFSSLVFEKKIFLLWEKIKNINKKFIFKKLIYFLLFFSTLATFGFNSVMWAGIYSNDFFFKLSLHNYGRIIDYSSSFYSRRYTRCGLDPSTYPPGSTRYMTCYIEYKNNSDFMSDDVKKIFSDGPQYTNQEIYNFILSQFDNYHDKDWWVYEQKGNCYIQNLLLYHHWKIIYWPNSNIYIAAYSNNNNNFNYFWE